ncbi:MAG: PilZ domain-containing protein [Armatimonadetes bacterium]|nr:PilZ domain-containing protein [Armatimonadota bacterium]
MFFWRKKTPEETQAEEEFLERRQFYRLPTQIQVTCITAGQEFQLLCRDLSAGGLRYLARGAFSNQTLLTVVLNLGKGIPPMRVQGRVVWTKQPQPGVFEGGIEFLGVNDKDRDIIVKFVNDYLLDLRRRERELGLGERE